MCAFFRKTVASLDLTKPASLGTSSLRSNLWMKTLKSAAAEVRRSSDSSDICEAKRSCLKSIRTMAEAKEEGKDAVSVFRYFYEDKLKYCISSMLLSNLPFSEEANVLLTNAKVKDICTVLSRSMNILQNSDSLLLRRFPINAVITICEVFQEEEGGLEVKWWTDWGNVAGVQRDAKHLLDGKELKKATPKSYASSQSSEASVAVFALALEHFEHFFERDTIQTFENVYERFHGALRAFASGNCDNFPYMSDTEVKDILKKVKVLDEVYATEIESNMKFQLDSIEFTEMMKKRGLKQKEKAVMERLAMHTYKDDDLLTSSAIPLLRDMAECVRDLASFWISLKSDSDIVNILEGLGDKTGIELYRVLSLAQVFCSKEGQLIQSGDVSLRDELLSRIAESGEFLPPRSKRARSG